MSNRKKYSNQESSEFLPNYASGGKKPLGPGPRIGLSRNVRPLPKLFKCPIITINGCATTSEKAETTPKCHMSSAPRIGVARIPQTMPNSIKNSNKIEQANIRLEKIEKQACEIKTRKRVRQNILDEVDDNYEIKKTEKELNSENLNTIQKKSTKVKNTQEDKSKSPESKHPDNTVKALQDWPLLIPEQICKQNVKKQCSKNKMVRETTRKNNLKIECAAELVTKKRNRKNINSDQDINCIILEESLDCIRSKNLARINTMYDEEDKQSLNKSDLDTKIDEQGDANTAENSSKNISKIQVTDKIEHTKPILTRKISSLLSLKQKSIDTSAIADAEIKEATTPCASCSETNIPKSSDMEALILCNLNLKLTQHEVSVLQEQVEKKKIKVRAGEAAILKQKENLDELTTLTKQWEHGSKQVLIALHKKMTSMGHQDINMDMLLKKFNISNYRFNMDLSETTLA